MRILGIRWLLQEPGWIGKKGQHQPGHPHGRKISRNTEYDWARQGHTRIKIGGGVVFLFLLVNYYSHSGYLVYGERPHLIPPPPTSPIRPCTQAGALRFVRTLESHLSVRIQAMIKCGIVAEGR